MEPVLIALGLLLVRDDGRYANSPLKPWFNSLASQYGLCCSIADGAPITDKDWRQTATGDYEVFIEGNWVPVPPGAVIKTFNVAGVSILFLMHNSAQGIEHDENGRPVIRCFVPAPQF